MISQRVRHFLAVADCGSFTQAAARLGIDQPPLSQSIQRLEKDLEVTLFERTSRGVRLTQAGEAFLGDARIAATAADRARAAARAAAASEKPLRVGVILPAIWGPLRDLVVVARGVSVRIDFVDGSTTELLEMLSCGRLDLSFLSPPLDENPDLQLIQIGREPLVAALPKDLAAIPGEYAPMREMASQLIIPPRSYGPSMHDAIINMFRLADLTPVIAAETTRVLTMLALTSAEVGAAIVAPSLARSITMDGVSFKPFAPPTITPFWEIALGYYAPAAGSALSRLVAALNSKT